MRFGIALTSLAALMVAFVLAVLPGGRSQPGSGGFVGALLPSGDRGEDVSSYVRALPVRDGGVDLAAAVSQVGHWHFSNRDGETFTAAGQQELARALATLAPTASAGEARIRIHMDAGSLIEGRAALRALPESAELSVRIDGRNYRVERPDSKDAPVRIQIGRAMSVEATDEDLAREALRQLERPVVRSAVRMIALEPGGAAGLARAPVVERGARHARPDVIDPGHLPSALGGVGGQIVLVSGRLEQGRLFYRPGSGPPGEMSLPALEAAVRDSDANLVILDASSARQPGTRNWVWQRVALGSMDAALGGATFGEFLHALAGAPALAIVRAERIGDERIELALDPQSELPAAPVARLTQVVSGTWSSFVSETAGAVSVRAVRASLITVARQREIDRRIVPGVPFVVQLGYVLLIVAGVLAWPTVNAWWRLLWPAEVATEYHGRGGFMLAKMARAGALVLVFLPLAGVPALVARLARIGSAKVA